jgi:hypothetical protein
MTRLEQTDECEVCGQPQQDMAHIRGPFFTHAYAPTTPDDPAPSGTP